MKNGGLWPAVFVCAVLLAILRDAASLLLRMRFRGVAPHGEEARLRRLEPWPRVLPSFETPRFARLLRMTAVLVIQERPQLPAPRRMLQLPQRLGLDLADTLSGHRELLADFFQGVVGVHADAEAHAEYAFFAGGERGQHAGGGFREVALDRGVDWQDRVLVLDEIAEMRVFLITNGGFKRQRFFRDLENLADLLQGHAEFFGEFFRGRFAADF